MSAENSFGDNDWSIVANLTTIEQTKSKLQWVLQSERDTYRKTYQPKLYEIVIIDVFGH